MADLPPERPPHPLSVTERTTLRNPDTGGVRKATETVGRRPGTEFEEEAQTVSRWVQAKRAMAGFFSHDTTVVVVLVGAFLVRWLLAHTQSYWLDELYSVAIYGIWNDSALEAVRSLASSSVHPPLYQFVLVNWMDVFGDGETAARSLSNLYVTMAGLFLYLLTRDAFNRLVAIWSTIVFSLMYTTMFFGLESRSYAQTIFLVTLSSYLVLRVLDSGARRGFRYALISPGGAFLVLANTALLLTHYYNLFFLIAQGVLAVTFVLIRMPRRRWLGGLGMMAVASSLPLALFATIWGRVFLDTYIRRSDEFAVEGAAALVGPLEVLNSGVIEPNLAAPGALLVIGGLIATALLVRAGITVTRSRADTVESRPAFTTLYLGGWLVLPAVVAHLVFWSLGVARYSDRYFLFSTIPLAPLVILSLDEAWRRGRVASRRLRGMPYALLLGATCSVVVAAIILPGTHGAASSEKEDWRGTAEAVVGLVEADPASSYTVYETSFRTTPVLDYYLARYSEEIRVDGTIRRAEERRGHNYAFERNDDAIRQHDYLIVVFTHHSTAHFPIGLELLGQRFETHHSHLDRSGRGYVVFRVS